MALIALQFSFMKTLHALFCLPLALGTAASADIQSATDSVFTPWEQGFVDLKGKLWPNFWTTQNETTLDGMDAAVWDGTSLDGSSLEKSWLKTTVTGPAVIHFSYALKPMWTGIIGEGFGSAFFRAAIDGATAGDFPAGRTWEEGSITVEAGSHSVEWQMGNIYNTSLAYLDQIWTDDDPRPRVTGPVHSEWEQGVALNIPVTTNKPCTEFAATDLPPGVTIDTGTGVLSGTPTRIGTYFATIKGTNAAGSHVRALRIRVTPAQSAAPVSLADALDGAGVSWSQNQIGWTESPASGFTTFADWQGAAYDASHDTTDAAVVILSAKTATNKLRTEVTGPGIFSVWSRLVKPAGMDSFSQGEPSGVVHLWTDGQWNVYPDRWNFLPLTEEWKERTLKIPTGRHSIEWAVAPSLGRGEPAHSLVVFDQATMTNSPQAFTFENWLEFTAPGSGRIPSGYPAELLARDPESDGLGLLVEYALGGSPAINDSALLPEVSIVDGHLTMTVQKPQGISGVEYTVQANLTLASNGWTTFNTEIMNEDQNVLVVRYKKSVLEVPSCSMRLRVRLDDSVGP